MIRYSIRAFFLATLAWLAATCREPLYPEPSDITNAYEPVYVKPQEAQRISVEEPRALGNVDEVLYKDSMLIVLEWFAGIHVFDNSDPSDPVALRFVKVSGMSDASLDGDILYANNLTDLATIDLSDAANPTLLKVHENILQMRDALYPPQTNTYFECVDPEKGHVVSWRRVAYSNQQCFR